MLYLKMWLLELTSVSFILILHPVYVVGGILYDIAKTVREDIAY